MRRDLRAGSLAAAGVCGALLYVALALPTPPSASAAATCPGHNGRIAVAVHDSEGSTIGLVGQGGQLNPLFDPVPQMDGFSGPSFSCDGSQIIYSGRLDIELCCNFIEIAAVPSGRKLHWMEEGSSTFPAPPFPTPAGPLDPSYLSDGQIIFSAASDEGGATYIVGPHGEDRRRLFNAEPWTSTAGGRWFVGGGPPNGRENEQLWLLNEKGNPVNRISAAPVREGRRGQFAEYLHPSFSPDGQWITYCKGQPTSYYSGPKLLWSHKFPQHFDLYLVRRDGTHRQRLTHNGLSCFPSFSPDGRKIVFIYGEEEHETNVAVLPLAHPGRIRLLTHLGPEVRVSSPTWGPR